MSTRFTAQWLRRSRRQFEMKQLHLADELGVSQVMISKWETGAEIPCKKQKRKLYHFFSSCHPTFPDHLMKSLVESSKMYTHLMCDTSHVLLAASESRASQIKFFWPCNSLLPFASSCTASRWSESPACFSSALHSYCRKRWWRCSSLDK